LGDGLAQKKQQLYLAEKELWMMRLSQEQYKPSTDIVVKACWPTGTRPAGLFARRMIMGYSG
jgi:hypothetical protein